MAVTFSGREARSTTLPVISSRFVKKAPGRSRNICTDICSRLIADNSSLSGSSGRIGHRWGDSAASDYVASFALYTGESKNVSGVLERLPPVTAAGRVGVSFVGRKGKHKLQRIVSLIKSIYNMSECAVAPVLVAAKAAEEDDESGWWLVVVASPSREAVLGATDEPANVLQNVPKGAEPVEKRAV
jgi:hypothetical protein